MTDAVEPVPPRPASLVRVQIGNKVYNARRVPGCLTCNHPARMDIETRLVEGHPYHRISHEFSGTEYTVGRQKKTLPPIPWTSIRTHYLSGHLPIDAKAVRDIAEQRLKELGMHAEQLEERMIDSYMMARLAVSKGFERIARGEVEVTVKEALAAAKMLEEFDIASRNAANGDQEAWQEAMTLYFQEAQQLMAPEMWREFGRRLMSNPQLKALAERLDGSKESDSSAYVEAEVVESRREGK